MKLKVDISMHCIDTEMSILCGSVLNKNLFKSSCIGVAYEFYLEPNMCLNAAYYAVYLLIIK